MQKRVWHDILLTSLDVDESSKDWTEYQEELTRQKRGNFTRSCTRSTRLTKTCTANDSKPKGDHKVLTHFPQIPNRQVCWMAKTTHKLRETLAISQEEAGDMGFVPSAFSEPRGAHSWCDNRCSNKALRSMQIASMVIEEGGEAHTINLCKLCYSAKHGQQGKQPLSEGKKRLSHASLTTLFLSSRSKSKPVESLLWKHHLFRL